jgi:hypothetical protein
LSEAVGASGKCSQRRDQPIDVALFPHLQSCNDANHHRAQGKRCGELNYREFLACTLHEGRLAERANVVAAFKVRVSVCVGGGAGHRHSQ